MAKTKQKPKADKTLQKKAVAKAITVEKEMEELSKKASDKKYSNQAYSESVDVNIPGSLWANMIRNQAESHAKIEEVRIAFKAIDGALQELQHRGSILTKYYMEHHMKFVDAGLTTTIPEEEIKQEEDASNS